MQPRNTHHHYHHYHRIIYSGTNEQ